VTEKKKPTRTQPWYTKQRDFTPRKDLPKQRDFTPLEEKTPIEHGADKRPEEEQVQLLLSQLEAGLPPSSAATLAGISKSQIASWARLAAEANAEGLQTRYTRLWDRIQEATAKFEQSILSKVIAGVDKDPKLGLEILRRRFPANWAEPQTRIQLSTNEQSDEEIDARIAELTVQVKHMLPGKPEGED
jgi:hypothetical protein